MPPDPEELEARIAECDELLASERASEDRESALRVASALRRKGDALFQLARQAEALACFEELTGQFSDEEDPELRALVAETLGEQARVLGALGRYADADGAFAELLARYGADEDPRLRRASAIGTYNRAAFLHRAGLEAEALDTVEVFLARYRSEPPGELRDLVVLGLALRSSTLWALGRIDDAVAGYRELAGAYADDADTAVVLQVIRALREQATLARQADRATLALASYDEVIARYGDAWEHELLAPVVRTLHDKAELLNTLGRHEQAITTFDELIERFTDEPPADAPLIALGARYGRAFALRQLKRDEQAVAACRELIDRYDSDERVFAREVVVSALSLQRNVAAAAKDVDAVLALDDAILARLRGALAPERRMRLAKALADKVWWLARADRIDEAVAAIDELRACFAAERDDEDTAEQIAAALLRSGTAMLDFGAPPHPSEALGRAVRLARSAVPSITRRRRRMRESIAAVEPVIDRYRDASEPRLRSLALEAGFHKGSALLFLGHPHAAWSVLADLGADAESFDRWAEREQPRGGWRSAAVLRLRSMLLE